MTPTSLLSVPGKNLTQKIQRLDYNIANAKRTLRLLCFVCDCGTSFVVLNFRVHVVAVTQLGLKLLSGVGDSERQKQEKKRKKLWIAVCVF